MHPREIRILSSEVTAESSTLQVEGERNHVLGTGTVEMLLENGEWKVQKESWSFKKK